jgi:CheY-like chemotaxis protein
MKPRVRPGAGGCGRCDTDLVPLTVLIVDDYEGFRQVARQLLEADGVEVVGEAADGESAIARGGEAAAA